MVPISPIRMPMNDARSRVLGNFVTIAAALFGCAPPAPDPERVPAPSASLATGSTSPPTASGASPAPKTNDHSIAFGALDFCAVTAERRLLCSADGGIRLVDGVENANHIRLDGDEYVVATDAGLLAVKPRLRGIPGGDEVRQLPLAMEVADAIDGRFRCTRDFRGRVTCSMKHKSGIELALDRPAIAMAAIDDELYVLQEDGKVGLWVCAGPDPCEPTGSLCDGAKDACELQRVADPALPSSGIRSLHQGPGLVCVVDGSGTPTCGRQSTWRKPQRALCINKARKVVDVAPGGTHACALHEDGRVSCCGENDWGQLGSFRAADSDDLVTVDGLEDVRDVAADPGRTCARTARDVLCWGRRRTHFPNERPRKTATLPVDGVDRVLVAGSTTCALKGTELQCFGERRGKHTFPSSVRDVALARGEACAALSDGSVSCHSFGASKSTVPEGLAPITAIEAGVESFCAVANGRSGVCWGKRDLEPAAVGGVLRLPGEVSFVDAGSNGGCSLSRLGAVSCWGASTKIS